MCGPSAVRFESRRSRLAARVEAPPQPLHVMPAAPPDVRPVDADVPAARGPQVEAAAWRRSNRSDSTAFERRVRRRVVVALRQEVAQRQQRARRLERAALHHRRRRRDVVERVALRARAAALRRQPRTFRLRRRARLAPPPPPPSLPSPTGRARFLDLDAARGGGAGAVKSCGNAKSASTSASGGTGGKPHETRCFGEVRRRLRLRVALVRRGRDDGADGLVANREGALLVVGA